MYLLYRIVKGIISQPTIRLYIHNVFVGVWRRFWSRANWHDLNGLHYPDPDKIMEEDSMVCLDDFEKHAVKVMARGPLGYYQSGADDEVTLKDNQEAFKR